MINLRQKLRQSNSAKQRAESALKRNQLETPVTKKEGRKRKTDDEKGKKEGKGGKGKKKGKASGEPFDRSKVKCKFHVKGTCNKGKECPFDHS